MSTDDVPATAATTADAVRRTYVTLMAVSTLAASMIWGVNTIFLLDAGLSNLEAFGANAFYTVGMVVFEIPTGVVADTRGRRVSYLLGTAVLAVATGLYLLLWVLHAPFAAWALASLLLGFGFTFFSGATEAWLVDALAATGYDGPLEKVFGQGQVATGVAMLVGSVGGGVLAQATSLGVPFAVRAGVLLVAFVIAALLMHDLGFTPQRTGSPGRDMRALLSASLEHGLRNPPVRWVMLAAPFVGGTGFYAFYALQPYVLELWGDPTAYALAGVVAAGVAGAQVVGGFSAPLVRRLVGRRTTTLVAGTTAVSVLLVAMGLVGQFAVVVGLMLLWAVASAAVMPVQQAYVNASIPSQQRATVLSFQSLMSSTGGVVFQPALGRVADVASYAATFVVSGVISAVAVPFYLLARRENAPADQPAAEEP